jgi:hypothetical protein
MRLTQWRVRTLCVFSVACVSLHHLRVGLGVLGGCAAHGGQCMGPREAGGGQWRIKALRSRQGRLVVLLRAQPMYLHRVSMCCGLRCRASKSLGAGAGAGCGCQQRAVKQRRSARP